jgi:hypothetical protein
MHLLQGRALKEFIKLLMASGESDNYIYRCLKEGLKPLEKYSE